MRNLALIGALLLVLAESRVESKSILAGVPSLGEILQILLTAEFINYTIIPMKIFVFFCLNYRRQQAKNLFTANWSCPSCFYVCHIIEA